jgi:hypothetical protein
MKNNNLFGWVFHQDMEDNWCAAKREYYFELFNGDKGNVLRSPDIKVLVELITKTDGDKAQIQKLLGS